MIITMPWFFYSIPKKKFELLEDLMVRDIQSCSYWVIFLRELDIENSNNQRKLNEMVNVYFFRYSSYQVSSLYVCF